MHGGNQPDSTGRPFPIVLSHYQVVPLLKAREAGERTSSISPDLNLTVVELEITAEGVVFPGGERLTWADCESIAGEENKCFMLKSGSIEDIQVFSETTNWLRSLYPTEGAPTMLVSGTPMHRIKDTDPYRDTLKKIKAVRAPNGVVLDTATGLGYTAIEAAKTAEHVITVELDPAGLEVARYNPWSRELFNNPKIEQIVGDVYDVVEDSEDAAFSVIIHDPPAFSLAGDLYSAGFYGECHRVLKARGRMFHYIGDPDSKSGQGVTRGVLRRLQDVGFSRIVRRPEAFGMVAYK
jgi:predicted methyltransferase